MDLFSKSVQSSKRLSIAPPPDVKPDQQGKSMTKKKDRTTKSSDANDSGVNDTNGTDDDGDWDLDDVDLSDAAVKKARPKF